MLNKIRTKVEPFINSLSNKLANSVSPNTLTVIGFLVSIVSGIFYGLYNMLNYALLYGGITLLISGFFDVIDGSVARVSNKLTKRGAFLDSTLDRVAEVVIYAGIIYSGVADKLLTLFAITFSLLVSYTRARAESLGVELKGVGIGERAERLLILAIVSILADTLGSVLMNYGIAIIFILASITFIQRVILTINKLS